ncbi:hypothetical protein ACFX13_028957 [Malus domestica]|uniref:uncharacterized protein LOC126590258 n=1 Tax=Malus sylvestris TaxID=3752 RepID=UPI0021AD47B6|nr:uncharacterized protein LOC126590258 [Malus sylvestris]XP_050111719.1 uncharacterized protein LOC126590258 [Malus sylvestris]XP_050111723.1 uncharacterized protein LOC126590258 [Malus sylvestris]
MDHYDLHRQRRDLKHKGRNVGRNVVWSLAMDKCLIDCLAIQARHGNKIDKSFNEHAYTAACIAVNSRFNLNLNNQKVINRLKTIKKRYKAMKDILSQDGFRWNPTTKMIECDNEELWKRYIAAHPDAKGFRGKPIEMYDELKIVCGNYQVPSRWAKMKDGGHPSEMKNFEDDSASFLSPSSDDLSETDGTESYSGPEEEFTKLPDGSQDPPLIQPLRQLPKRPRGSEAVQDALMTVASSIRCLADAMEQSKYSIDASQLLQAVMEIDGLEEAKQMYAFEYLNADPVKARAFMTYDARMRKIYLFRQFWWWK